jgi:hypothetical protein
VWPKLEKVCESMPKHEKVCESMLEIILEKFGESIKCFVHANANCNLVAVQTLIIFYLKYKSLLPFFSGVVCV